MKPTSWKTKNRGKVIVPIVVIVANNPKDAIINHIAMARMAISTNRSDWNEKLAGDFSPTELIALLDKEANSYDATSLDSAYSKMLLKMSGINYPPPRTGLMKFVGNRFRNFHKYFWWAYVLLPLLTGFLSYHWLPDESYDDRRHELLASRTVDTNPVGGSEEAPQEWRSKTSGRIYTRASFAEHRHSEAIRMSFTAFLYGLIGCFVFAYGQVIKKLSTFIVAFKRTLFYDATISILILFFVW